MPLAPGTRLGPYEIESPLGAGGMGEVYRARDTRLERAVAIKILPLQLSADPARKQRFEREAKTISSLNHPHICTLHDVGSQDGVDYLVMECVEGETLAKRLEKGPLPLEQVLKIGQEIAGALDKAHRSGVVHRDLKPGNVMLTATGAKVLDFGLAKPTAPMVTLATMTAAVPQQAPVTQEGTIVGTFQYMSPEQVEGKELDGRSDIFSLGAVNDTGGAYYPFWSPDGREIAFFGDGKLKRVAADGGPVQVICDAPDARGGSWGSSGIIIFAATRLSPILRVAADGGTPVAIAEVKPSSVPAAEVLSHRWPHFLPDGEHFLYLNAPNGSCTELNELHFASIDGKQDVLLMRTCSSATFANGNLLFWRDGNVVAQRFDQRTGVLSGAPAAIVEHANFEPLFSIAEFSVSGEGKLVYMAGDAPTGSQLVWYDRNGKVTGTLGENDRYKNVAISRDGLHVVADTISVKESKIRILDSRGTRTLMTLGNSDGAGPAWSPDGKQIYFTSTANGPQDIYVRAADGSGEEKPVLKFRRDQFGALFLTVSPDGKSLAYAIIDRATGGDIYTLALGGDSKPQPFLHSVANETAPAFSPDGRWLAYESDASGRREAYITPFPTGGAQYQVSTSGGERPVWRHDGKEIYYREGLRIMAVEVNTKASPVEFGSPKALFELASGNLNGRYYDVAPDGRFLANTSPLTPKAQSFSLVVNWPGRLKK